MEHIPAAFRLTEAAAAADTQGRAICSASC